MPNVLLCSGSGHPITIRKNDSLFRNPNFLLNNEREITKSSIQNIMSDISLIRCAYDDNFADCLLKIINVIKNFNVSRNNISLIVSENFNEIDRGDITITYSRICNIHLKSNDENDALLIKLSI